MVIWFTGMSGAGKSTLCDLLSKELGAIGKKVTQLDGDRLRQERKTENHFTRQSIVENNRVAIDLCRELNQEHDFVLVSLIAPFTETRDLARRTLGKDYIEIYVKAAIQTLVKRDTKGLYKKAQDGLIDNLIGFGSKIPYEEPVEPDMVIQSDQTTPQEAIAAILRRIQPRSAVSVPLQ